MKRVTEDVKGCHFNNTIEFQRLITPCPHSLSFVVDISFVFLTLLSISNIYQNYFFKSMYKTVTNQINVSLAFLSLHVNGAICTSLANLAIAFRS